jgi:hypothetical protein
MTANKDLTYAARAAIHYLLTQQNRDGHWKEYSLPVGKSDAWVTGYVGFALARAAKLGPSLNSGLDTYLAAFRASNWLRGSRTYKSGWGYNSHTGPDADSTAWVLRLLLCLGIPADRGDVEFLLSRLCAEGGFATYDGPGYWGAAHPDVTPAVFLGLPLEVRSTIEQRVVDYLHSVRAPDGTWPSYWWRTCHYATYLNVELADVLGQMDTCALPVVSKERTHRIYSAFDLACVTGIAAIRSRDSKVIGALVRELVRLQRHTGMWPGGANLRVTDSDCAQPWVDPRGKLYCDSQGLITTATALCVLARAISS